MIYCDDITALDDAIDFLKIREGNRFYYGGTQSWFNSKILKKVGCSIVTAANIVAYEARNLKNKNLYNYDDMSKENFLKTMESIAKFIHPDAQKGVTSLDYFQKEVGDFSKEKGVRLIPHSTTTKDNFFKVKNFIKKALKENKPVALLMLKNNILKEFDWHWMTITRIFENTDKTYLDFSTWGERRIFTLEDFYNFSSFGALGYFDGINL